MDTWMGKAIFDITLIEATVLSAVVALGLSWLGLRGFFRMLASAKPSMGISPSIGRPATHRVLHAGTPR